MGKKRKKLQNKFEKMVAFSNALKFDYSRKGVTLLGYGENIIFSKEVIGHMRCPLCKSKDVIVANPKGLDGPPLLDYLMNHRSDGRPIGKRGGIICEGSLKRLSDIKV